MPDYFLLCLFAFFICLWDWVAVESIIAVTGIIINLMRRWKAMAKSYQIGPFGVSASPGKDREPVYSCYLTFVHLTFGNTSIVCVV